ncbi:MAG: hypothetical protein KA146_05380 [Leptospiraceae bacterium]|jgi:hypothetical protein|nr:hypothetical protein [Leptospiraceae bacterium]
METKKEKQIKRKYVEELVRKKLDSQGYKMNHHQDRVGVSPDIIAEKDDVVLYVEVIGFKSSARAATRDFYEVFFRAFAQLEQPDSDQIIIAMPIQFLKDMKKRIESMKNGWVRLCIAFPEITVYFVDLKQEKIYKKRLPEILHTEEEV